MSCNARELILSASQLTQAGGVLPAALANVAVNPTAGADHVHVAVGATIETYSFVAAKALDFDVEVGADAAATEANWIAEIVAKSALLKTAAASTALGSYFAGTPAPVMLLVGADAAATPKIYGSLTTAAGVKVVSFGENDYSTSSATEANLPATAGAAAAFGFGRQQADLIAGEAHECADTQLEHIWSGSPAKWFLAEDYKDSAAVLTDLEAHAGNIDTHTEETADHCHSLDAKAGAGRLEMLLNSGQLSTAQGIMRALMTYVATNHTIADTFVLKDGTGAGTVTETFTFVAARAVAFEVTIGLNAAATQTNLIAAIVSDSTIWYATANSILGATYFAATPASVAIIRRKTYSATAVDRCYGTLAAPAGMKVVSFSEADYTVASSTEANLPAADPAALRFGFCRAAASLLNGESHVCTDMNSEFVWSSALSKWFQREQYAEVESLLLAIDTQLSLRALETGGHLEEAADHLHNIDEHAVEAADHAHSIDGKLADVTADIIAAGNMNAAIAAVPYDISTNAPGRRNGALQLYSAADTRAGTITVKASADGGTNFMVLPIMDETMGAVTAGTVAVTAGAAVNVLVKLPECGYSDLRVEYADGTGGTGAGTLKASITMR
jgi:hypothetical protein